MPKLEEDIKYASPIQSLYNWVAKLRHVIAWIKTIKKPDVFEIQAPLQLL